MELTGSNWTWKAGRGGVRKLPAFVLLIGMLCTAWSSRASAEVGTTTVQGTVYLADGRPGSGMVHVSWPAFTSANGQAIVADSVDVTIGDDGFLSLNLAPNQGALPGGLFYTAVFYLNDGSTSTQYWSIPAAGQASLAQVQAQVMPAAQAVQTVNKAYVDGAITQLSQTMLTGSGGTLTGPLFLSGDPTQPLQAADKHYVDSAITLAGVGSGSKVNAASPGQVAYYSDGITLSGLSAVPVSAGGTGATSVDGALQSLGGLSVAKGSMQTMAGALNAPIADRGGEKFDVTAYGAKGDCTPSGSSASCTKNRGAIQAAIDAAAAVKGYIYLPPNPLSIGVPSVYFVEGTLNPKGVSIVGPQKGDIVNAGVAVRGAPGLDVFAPGDPTSVGYVTPSPSFHWTNLHIIVDDSVDASASFPHRLPGKTVYDGVVTASSAVVTSSKMLFQPGDVGNAFLCYGCGPAGANLDTTIASVQSLTQATMSAAASTSVASNAHFYLSIKGLSVTQTVGNCGLAYDDYSSSSYLSHGLDNTNFENVTVQSVSNAKQNKSCGFFFQGDGGVYSTHWSSPYVQGLDFGMVFVPPTAGAMTGASGIADFNTYENGYIGANYSWISYGGLDDKIASTQLCDAQGPHILLAPNSIAAPYPTQWLIDIPEHECTGAGAISYRVSGQNHVVQRAIGTTGATLQWDANNAVVQSYTPAEAIVNLAGNHNEFHIAAYPAGAPATFNSPGIGNTWDAKICAQGYSDCYGRARMGTAGSGLNSDFLSSYGASAVSRSAKAFDRKADFIWDGDDAYYFNRDDLWMWPTEVHADGGYVVTYQADTTSATGSDLLVNNTTYILNASNNQKWYFGKQIPAKKVRFIVRAKASTTINGWTAQLATNAGGYTVLCTATMNLTTTAQNGYCEADASSVSGSPMYISLNASGDTAKQVQIEYLAIRPWTSKVLALDVQTSTLEAGTSLQLAGGTAMTGNHGSGVALQHSDGTGTAGHAAVFAAEGSVTNGPALPAVISGTVASGSLTLATNAIASGSCQAITAGSLNSAAAAGVVTTDTISFNPNASIKGVAGYTPSTNGGLTIAAYPTAGYVNFDVCNWSGSSITPGAVTVNWKVTR